MGQCSSENSCQADFCHRSCRSDCGRRKKVEDAPAAGKDEIRAGDEDAASPRLPAELPIELAGALAKAVEASAIASAKAVEDKVAEFEGRWPSPPASPKSVNVSLPKCKHQGVQTEPLPPEIEVLPETFFIPEGEPWELATSTTGDW